MNVIRNYEILIPGRRPPPAEAASAANKIRQQKDNAHCKDFLPVLQHADILLDSRAFQEMVAEAYGRERGVCYRLMAFKLSPFFAFFPGILLLTA